MASTGLMGEQGVSAEAMPSLQERDLLLRRLADLAVLPPGRVTPQERALVDMVMATAVSRLDVAQRCRIAERVAQLPEGPRELTLALARDTIEVAAPVLAEAANIQGSDLVEIIRVTSMDHRLAIAGRKTLPPAAIDALIEYGNADVVRRMLENRSTEIPGRSMEVLVRRSASEPELHASLLERPELNQRLALLMFWWVSSGALRVEILNRHAVERRMMHIAIADVLEAGLAASGADEALRVALSLVRPPATIAKPQLTRLVNLAALGQREEFVMELAREARLRPETAFRIVSDFGGEPLAVLAKALGLSRQEFGDLIVAVAELRSGYMPAKSDIERITAVFDTISTDRADLVLHLWDWSISGEAQFPPTAEE
ncbi:MAG: DUF2336 domain-containing protein [Parvibaculum sp.]|uniref:DUF2336 domain-containing protein n=1 Tax=Parvibaculum sp. TaxID=2024848 RepID=UPI003C743BB8